MNLDELDLSETVAGTVVGNRALTAEGATEEVRELTLELETRRLEFEVGQSVAVLAPGDPTLGEYRHVRLYTIADAPDLSAALSDTKPRIMLCVRRCHYVDEFSGEAHDGIASNYLCDRRPGDPVSLVGPLGAPFVIPTDRSANLLMIGLGTGIAPFRAFVRHIYTNLGGWQGKVRIFHGAHTGLEMLYRNDKVDDFAQYMDKTTFAAFEAVSPRPAWGEPVDFKAAFRKHEAELKALLEAPDTYVYVAGLAILREVLEAELVRLFSGTAAWQRKKQELVAGQRLSELLY